jgi:predicted AlkP superfamily pyrophosphatase or phosphodiesterase
MYGPYSTQMRRKLEELDDYLGYLIDQLKENNLFHRMNLIITSDHGMESIAQNTTIYLDSYIDTNLFESYGSRACYVLFVKKGN